jgi:hypothetical protein
MPEFLHIRLYAFRSDLKNDAREEVTFKVRFGDVVYGRDDKHAHLPRFEVLRATGEAVLRGEDGELIVAGHTGEVINGSAGVGRSLV